VVQSIAIVYLCIFLSVHSHISKTTGPDFTKFFVHVTYVGHGSVFI